MQQSKNVESQVFFEKKNVKYVFSNTARSQHGAGACFIYRCAIPLWIYASLMWVVSWLAFNGTFSTNRLYRAIEVWNISRRAGGQDKYTTNSKQCYNTLNQENRKNKATAPYTRVEQNKKTNIPTHTDASSTS